MTVAFRYLRPTLLVILNLVALTVLALAVYPDETSLATVEDIQSFQPVSDITLPKKPPVVPAAALSRPIFHADRKPYEPPKRTPVAKPPAPRPAQEAPPSFRLIGILYQNAEQAWAYVSIKGEKRVRRLSRGDVYRGWTVSDISENRLVLSKRERKIEITLNDRK